MGADTKLLQRRLPHPQLAIKWTQLVAVCQHGQGHFSRSISSPSYHKLWCNHSRGGYTNTFPVQITSLKKSRGNKILEQLTILNSALERYKSMPPSSRVAALAAKAHLPFQKGGSWLRSKYMRPQKSGVLMFSGFAQGPGPREQQLLTPTEQAQL